MRIFLFLLSLIFTSSAFAADGLLHIAQPHVLRPNYVLQNGVWVQQGFLRETATTNYALEPPITSASSGIVVTNSSGMGSGINTYDYSINSSAKLTAYMSPQYSIDSSVIGPCFISGWIKLYSLTATFYLSALHATNYAFSVVNGVPQNTNALSFTSRGDGYYYFQTLLPITVRNTLNIGFGTVAPTSTGLQFTLAGVQVETSQVTSYIPATTTPATRTAD